MANPACSDALVIHGRGARPPMDPALNELPRLFGVSGSGGAECQAAASARPDGDAGPPHGRSQPGRSFGACPPASHPATGRFFAARALSSVCSAIASG